MTTPKFGSLTPVDLRECWPREDSDFTPWLASEENIALLGDAIGAELEVKEQEASVGSFSADILCRDVTNDSLVVIENQLERTDHSHLGQLITYAAGLEASTLVWVVKTFTEEHRAAIDWLNRNTDGDFHFFGIEVEVFRIGESAPAPRFEVVAKPNDWAKSTKQVSRSGTCYSELQKKHLAFWEVFTEQAKGDVRIRPIKPQPDMWLAWGVGGKESGLNAQLSFRKNWLVVNIYLGGAYAMAHFYLLKEQQEEIEQAMGYELEWDEREGKKSCSIEIKNHTDLEDRDQWPSHADWLIKHLADFQRVFRPRVKQLDASEWVPEEEGTFSQ
jgi:hypothetical protein